MTIQRPGNVDVSRVEFGAVKPSAAGTFKRAPLGYGAPDAPLVLLTPELTAPFGAGVWTDGDAKKVTLTLALPADTEEERQLRACLQALDLKVLEEARKPARCKEWLKRASLSAAVAEGLYTPTLKPSREPDRYAPTVRLTLPLDADGAFDFATYNPDRTSFDLAALLDKSGAGKRYRFRAIMECCGVWVAGGKFGLSWRARQLQVRAPLPLTRQPTQQDLRAFAFIDAPEE